jgi:plasmid stabilization system protein ParE
MDSIWMYWACRASEAVADGEIEKIEDGLQLVRLQPGCGRRVDALCEGVLRICVGAYLIYYRMVRGGVRVEHVVRGERNQRRVFVPRK